MSIRCQCPHCGTLVSVYERAIGHRMRCPFCSKLMEARPHQELAAPQNQAAPAPLVELQPLSDQHPADAAPPVAVPPPVEVGLVAVPSKRKPIIFRKDRQGQEAEMDMTPMVDVTFQLLIFFMLTASFTMQKAQNQPKPESNEPSTQQTVQDFQDNPDYVVVRIDSTGTYYVSSSAWEDEIEAPHPQELLLRLREARQGDAQGNVPSKMLVQASGEALHERVVTAIDAGNDVGMDEVQLVTVEDDE